MQPGTEKIGLIAGNRRFPVIFAEEARKRGVPVAAVAIKGETYRGLGRLVDSISWISLGEFAQMFQILRRQEVKKVVMAGQISPARLFSREVTANPQLSSFLSGMKDLKANTIFTFIAEKLLENGLELIDSTTFLEAYLPEKGVLTHNVPASKQLQDVEFGLNLAKQVARLDIGLTVAVKHRAIIAVEALEGTDNLIRRAGRMARGGITVVKVSRPGQDMRFDLPVIGLNTIKTLIRAKAACLAIEAKKTLFLDQQASLALADKNNLPVLAV